MRVRLHKQDIGRFQSNSLGRFAVAHAATCDAEACNNEFADSGVDAGDAGDAGVCGYVHKGRNASKETGPCQVAAVAGQ